MKLKELKSANQMSLWITPVDDLVELDTGLVELSLSVSDGLFKLMQNGKICLVRTQSVTGEQPLTKQLRKGCASLAYISQTLNSGSVLLNIHFFNGPLVDMGEVNIWLSDNMAHDFSADGQMKGDVALLLSEACVIDTEVPFGQQYFLLMTGAAVKEGDDNQFQDGDLSHFAVICPQFKVPVYRQTHPGEPDIYVASKLITKGFELNDSCLRLAKGQLQFSTTKRHCIVHPIASGTVERLTRQQGSYLKRWDEYGAIEGKMLLDRARAVGALAYRHGEKTAKGVKFFFDRPLPDALGLLDQLELVEQLPPYLENKEISWAEYCELIFQPSDVQIEKVDHKQQAFSIIQLSDDVLELALDIVPDSKKKPLLVLSINGDKVQVERRTKARELVLKERCGIQWLGQLIEEGGLPPKVIKNSTITPLSPFIEQKIFSHAPNRSQLKAIDKALNTPDICLIQGPPGTGKTTVITAIIERLNELQDKSESIKGRVLVSGYQHDAVENIISRLSVNALPAVKFGRRSGQSESAVDQQLNTWCNELVDRVRKQNPQVKQSEHQLRLSVSFGSYLRAPSDSNACSLLIQVLELPADILPSDLAEQAQNLLELLREVELPSKEHELALRLVRGLRVTSMGFSDDAKDRAAELLVYLEPQLSQNEQQLLRRAIIYQPGQPLDFLPSLKQFKKNWLIRLTKPPQFKIAKPREDILALIAGVSPLLERSKGVGDKKQTILAEYLHEMENNPEGVRRSLTEYNYVFAATTGQSAGTKIRSAKTSQVDEAIVYDTVIIDEAARVSPRDLLIPMVQAANRIILVGDHRQLPHMVDEQIAQALESEEPTVESDDENALIKLSMFKYLFERLKKLEKIDGICRTVTLNAQYRSHPLLGRFVSDQFYAQHNERFNSPLNSPNHIDKSFSHHLPGVEQHAAIWLEVEHVLGPEKTNPSKSRYRRAEAQKIAEQLASWIKSEAGQSLTFAVISFYKAQVFEIFKALAKFGITRKAADDQWEIVEKYRLLSTEKDGKTRTEERFRIGTVDAFQGMEFDVVFLSMVRSENWQKLPKKIAKQGDLKRRAQMLYGHLMSPNRLCVSMSRQKKLLVVAGDSEMVKQPLAKKFVPQLGAYYTLCEQQGLCI